MESIEYLVLIPWWYWSTAIIFGVFYSYRGIVERYVMLKQGTHYLSVKKSEDKKEFQYQITTCQKVVIVYIQEAILKFIVTISSFVSFYIACTIFPSPNHVDSISPGKAIVVIFLFVWGIIGICGYLSFFITRGKIPGLK